MSINHQITIFDLFYVCKENIVRISNALDLSSIILLSLQSNITSIDQQYSNNRCCGGFLLFFQFTTTYFRTFTLEK